MKPLKALLRFGLIAGVIAGGYLFSGQVVDMVASANYTPTAAIERVKNEINLTDGAARVFYASHPKIEKADRFNEVCADDEKEHSAVLGCYTQRKIYLFEVDNKELDGIVEVTAAHELLHAVYERMHFWEKDALKKLLNQEYDAQKKAGNTAFIEHAKLYSNLPTEGYVNELHSLLGTEVKTLSPELEKHYAAFFKDRKSLAVLYARYEGVFKQAEQESERLAKKIDTDTDEINAKIELYNTQSARLDSDIATFNTRADSGFFTSQRQFAARRAVLVGRSNALQAEYRDIQERTRKNEEYRARLKKIAIRIDGLNSSINSSVKPAADL